MLERIFDTLARWRLLVAEALATFTTCWLDVPWFSQLDGVATKIPNECGHVCILMILKYVGLGDDVDLLDLWDADPPPRGVTSQEDLVNLAAEFDLTLAYTNGITPSFLIGKIQDSQPVIVLVDYKKLELPPHLSTPDQGWHWLLVVGYGPGIFYVHDPLWRSRDIGGRYAEGGRWHPIPRGTLMGAMDYYGQQLGVYPVEVPQ